ncbi:MAG TPA: FAD-binding oxidoreductase [Vicinamibacterales bacterium]|jgi:glycolate dehydrogenase FAD-binding subunit|nr:FAD-binding oxidoreductase [Vicinamibacterales bacterium]
MVGLESFDGVAPRQTIEPASAEDVAATLAAASKERASVVLRGGGTKIGWGRTPASVDIVVSTKRLSAVVAHEHADLTATVQAGARLDEVNRVLARHGQWLPVESAFDESTIGGAIATNDSGPLRHRYGTPRDLLIGIRLALTDGRLIKAGGNVVKNVAGYDVGRLMAGSHGSLAAIVSATFKLMPLPAATNTVIATFGRADDLVAALAAITSSQLEASAIDVRAGGSATAGPYVLVLKFESTPGALNAHVQKARALIGGAATDIVSSQSEADLWRAHLRAPWASPGMVIRFAWLPASLGTVLTFLDDLRGSAADVEFIGRAAIGSGLVRVDADTLVQRNIVERLRSRTDVFRHVVVLRADARLKAQLDVWGPLGDAGALGASVKHALDPNGILNAGRGPV